MMVRGTEREKQREHAGLRIVAGLTLLTATLGQAQVMAPVGTMPDGSHHQAPATQTQSTPAKDSQVNAGNAQAKTAPAPPVPTPDMERLHSLKDDPANPAVIRLVGGKLSVKADNSAVDAILNKIAEQSGMKIQGLDRDYRVFGSYGPANPREVLSQLLSGSGFNIVMVGATADGAPRQLLLTARGDAPVTPPNPHDPQEEYHPPPRVVYHNPRPEPGRGEEMHRGPGSRGGVKSPQEILQELERMRQESPQNQVGSPQ